MTAFTVQPHRIGPMLPRIPCGPGAPVGSLDNHLRLMDAQKLEPAEELLVLLDLTDISRHAMSQEEQKILNDRVDAAWEKIGLPGPRRH